MTLLDFVLEAFSWLISAFFLGRIIEGRSCDRMYGKIISELEAELEERKK